MPYILWRRSVLRQSGVSARQAGKQNGARFHRPHLEAFEDRLLLSTFLVTNTNDAGSGSLRQAILDANAQPDVNTIAFSIGDGGAHTIHPTSPLPTVTWPVTIDATTQPGFAGVPLIELDGSSAGYVTGLTITAGASTVKGFVINNFMRSGIELQTNGGNVIAGNYIGTDITGTVSRPNGTFGVDVRSSENTVGGITADARNLISGNNLIGIALSGSNNSIQGNYVGTDVTGTQALGNLDGISVDGPGNVIGGTTCDARNLISGNRSRGLVVGAGRNLVAGNYIGTDVAGAKTLGNVSYGVYVSGPDNTIGGTVGSARNIVSGNSLGGIFLTLSQTQHVVIQGNYIGTDVTGTIAVPNNGRGVTLDNQASSNTIGGTAAGAGNLISGNKGEGIYFTGSDADLVQGNYIGTDITGTAPLPNGASGIYITASDITVGGMTTAARNLISGNTGDGVMFRTGGGVLLQGNYIGTDVTGTSALSNKTGVTVFVGRDSTIGGAVAGAGNLISGNTDYGIAIVDFYAARILIQGNSIGTAASGGASLGNGGGILTAGDSTTIGGITSGAGNLISGNRGDGVHIGNDFGSPSAQGDRVEGNFIGTDIAGAFALGNDGNGVALSNEASNNTIGGTVAGSANLISGNRLDGVLISNARTQFNKVQGNYIGTDLSGSVALGNGGNGVQIAARGNSATSVGGPMAGNGNTIAFNSLDGVRVDASTGNSIRRNSIFSHGALGIELINGGNNNQAFPILTSATSGDGITTIQGTLASTARTTFTLEFFADAVCNPSGFGEGEQFLGSLAVTTDLNGNATFAADFAVDVPVGQFITATATDPANNTSQFSQCLQVTPPDGPGGPGGARRRTPKAGAAFVEAVASLSISRPAATHRGSAETESEYSAINLLLPQRGLDLFFGALAQGRREDPQLPDLSFLGSRILHFLNGPNGMFRLGWEQDLLESEGAR